MELVSIVIPTHNRCDLLERAVNSALNQTYQNIEVIVVSDGSTDKTDELMTKLKDKSDKITYISYKPGKGGNYARNTGIKAANGEFVAFLDDDDEWHSDKIQKQVDIFNSDSQIGLVCTGIHAIYQDETATTIFIPPAKYDCSKEILFGNCIGSTTTVMVKNSLLTEEFMFDEKLEALQDYDLWIRLCQVTKVGVVKSPCVEYYNYIGNNQVSQFTDKYERAIAYISNKYQDKISVLSESEKIRREIYGEFLIAKKAIRNGTPKIARSYIKKASKKKLTKQAVVLWCASFF